MSTKIPAPRPFSVFTPFLRRFTDERARDLSETIALYNELRRMHRASVWAQDDAIERVSGLVVEAVNEVTELPESRDIAVALDRCQTDVLALETTIFTCPEPDWEIGKLSLKEQVDLSRFLRAKQHFLGNDERVGNLLVTALGNVFGGIAGDLPKIAEAGAYSPKVPLIVLMQSPGATVDKIIGTLTGEKLAEAGLFTTLQQQFYENVCLASGVDPLDEKRRKPLITADESDLPPVELVETYLRGTPFADLLLTPVPLAIPKETRFGGTWCVAPPGRGKTTLLHTMVMEDLAEDASVILMDSKGDLIEPFTRIAAIKDRLILIEPDPEHPIAINPLDIPRTNVTLAVDLLEYVFSSLLEFKMTPLQTTLFRSVLRAIIVAVPDPTLDTLRDFLANGLEKYQTYLSKLPDDLQDFFATEFNDRIYADRRREVVQRIRLLLDNDAMRAMLLAPKTRFDVGATMEAGKVIIINNSKARLGEQGAEFFGRFFIAQILAAAQQRAGRSHKKPVYFYIDECHNVISRDERIPTILDECRSQKIALILAHQRTEQIKSPDVLSALSNCAVRYANSDDEARLLAPKLRTSSEFLQSLRRGEFAAYVRDLTSAGVRLSVPRVDFARYPAMSAAEQRDLRSRMDAEFGRIHSPISPREPKTNSSAAIKPAEPHVDVRPEDRNAEVPPTASEGSSDWA